MKKIVCILLSIIMLLSLLTLSSFAEEKKPFVYDPQVDYDYSAIYVIMFHEYSYEDFSNDYFDEYVPSEVVVKEVKNVIPPSDYSDNYHAILRISYDEICTEKVLEFLDSLNKHPKVLQASIPSSVIYEPETGDYSVTMRGDINRDNAVDMKDLLELRKSIAGITVIDKDDIEFADVNCDEEINMKDVLILRKKIAGVE